MVQNKLRTGIAMVELVFAIVIIGFALLSVPNLLSVAAQSGYTALQQEAIAESSAHINLLLSKHWDENDAISGSPANILTTTQGDTSLAARNGGRIRTFASTPLPATVIGSAGETAGLNDLDDADGTTMRLRDFMATSVRAGDTVDTEILVQTSVQYINDAADGGASYSTSSNITFNFDPLAADPGGTTNIKRISTTLTSTNAADELNKKVIRLNAFSCNIGQQRLEMKDQTFRDFP